MLAGIATYIKRVRPEVMIGVRGGRRRYDPLRAGKRLPDSVGLFADGAAVKTIGRETFRICHELVDDMETVSTDDLCSDHDGFMETRCVLEPAGALAIAGVKQWVARTHASNLTLVATASGANMDFDRLRFVSERADSSETMLSVLVPEKAGSFRRLISFIEPRNVTEFSYRAGDALRASIYLSFQAAGSSAACREQDVEHVVSSMVDGGLEVTNLKDNELAKAHLSAAAVRRSRTSASSSPNGRVPSSTSWTRSTPSAGTSRSFSTATTAPTSAESSPGCRCSEQSESSTTSCRRSATATSSRMTRSAPTSSATDNS